MGFVVSTLTFAWRFLPFLAYYQLLVPGAFFVVYYAQLGTLTAGTELVVADANATAFLGGAIPAGFKLRHTSMRAPPHRPPQRT